MRKYLAAFLALGLGLAVATSATGAILDQEIEGPKFKPKKLKKKKYKKGELTVRTYLEGVEDGGEIPQKAKKVKIDFSKNIRLNHKAVKKCKADLENSTRKSALGDCKKAKVSKDNKSRAFAALPFGPGGSALLYDADVMAFSGGKKNFILWTRVEDLGVTTILPSKLQKAPGKKFKVRLNVTVPPLAGGIGALTDFQARVKRKNYVQGRCKSDKRKMLVRGTFKFTDAPKQKVKSRSKIKKCKKKK